MKYDMIASFRLFSLCFYFYLYRQNANQIIRLQSGMTLHEGKTNNKRKTRSLLSIEKNIYISMIV